jgi:hypothetical protein
MKKLTLLLALGFATGAPAQTIGIVNSTPQPSDARFAIIQGTAGLYQARFKLDRYTGQIWQADSGPWKPMKIVDLPAIPAPKSPRFQMFWLFGAQGTSSQILLDCQTGRTWQLRVDTWQPDQEPSEEKAK